MKIKKMLDLGTSFFTSVEKLKDYLNNNWDRIEENWNRSNMGTTRSGK